MKPYVKGDEYQMGATANRWNTLHYKQIKIAAPLDLAVAFKNACVAADVSMRSVLIQFMADYCKTHIDKKSTGYTTRRLRRNAVEKLINELSLISGHEEEYRDNIPLNLQGSTVYEVADQTVSTLDEAIEILLSAY
jgi:hypothetical protein